MAVKEIRSFSTLKALENEFSEAEAVDKIMKEEEFLSGSKSEKSQHNSRSNVFDWEQEEEEAVQNQNMQMFENNIMGIKTSDYEVAHEFLKNSRTYIKNDKEFEEISNDTCSGKQYSSDHKKSYGESEITSNQRPASARRKTEILKTDCLKPTNKNFSKLEETEKKPMHLENADLSDFINDVPQISAREYNSLMQKVHKSRHTIEELKNQTWKTRPPAEVIQRIIMGKTYSLNQYKSLKEKLELLDYAIKMNDGNAITVVVLFLEKTLKPCIFATNLNKRRKAFNHYLRYLESNGEWKALMDLLLQMNRKEDAIILNYRHISRIKSAPLKMHEIGKLQSQFREKQDVYEASLYIEEERTLLQKQIQMEKEDEISEKQGKNEVMRRHPRSSSALLKSLITTLYYCTLYHSQKPTDQFHPLQIKAEFKLTEKQYEWAVIPACAKHNRWADISEILTITNWLKKKTQRSFIGFDQISRILQNAGAPLDIVEKYVRLIDNLEMKLKMASFCRCHDVAIDTIIQMKDRQKLEKYRQHVICDERLRRRITNCLDDTSFKWK